MIALDLLLEKCKASVLRRGNRTNTRQNKNPTAPPPTTRNRNTHLILLCKISENFAHFLKVGGDHYVKHTPYPSCASQHHPLKKRMQIIKWC